MYNLQSGKLFERIDTDYSTNTFVLNPSAALSLYTCTTPAPITNVDGSGVERADMHALTIRLK